jgi:hypothetical protein
MIDVIELKLPPRPPAAERLRAALAGLECAPLPNALFGRAKSASERACVAYAEGHADIAMHELATMELWLELARRDAGDGVNAAMSTLSEADMAYELLTREWRRKALKAARGKSPKPLRGLRVRSRMTECNDER